MKCTECKEEFIQDAPVFLSLDTSDTKIYCEKCKPEEAFESTHKLAVQTIGRRIGQGTLPDDKPIKAEVKVITETSDVKIEDIKWEVVKQTKPEIDFKYDVIKEQLTKAVKKYEDLVVTEQNLTSVKNDKKGLSALKTKIDRFRIDEKNILLVPINEMESNLKDLASIIDNVLNPIKAGIQVFDDKTTAEKLVKVQGWLQAAYDKVQLLTEFRTVEVVFNSKKKDVESMVAAQFELQKEKVQFELHLKEKAEEEIKWIEQSVEQQEKAFDIKLNVQDYLDKYNNGTDPKQIITDIVKDAMNIVSNIAIDKAKEAEAKMKELEKQARIEEPISHGIVAPEIITRNGVNYDENGEYIGKADVFKEETKAINVETKKESTPAVFEFVFKMTGESDDFVALKAFADENEYVIEYVSHEEVV